MASDHTRPTRVCRQFDSELRHCFAGLCAHLCQGQRICARLLGQGSLGFICSAPSHINSLWTMVCDESATRFPQDQRHSKSARKVGASTFGRDRNWAKAGTREGRGEDTRRKDLGVVLLADWNICSRGSGVYICFCGCIPFQDISKLTLALLVATEV